MGKEGTEALPQHQCDFLQGTPLAVHWPAYVLTPPPWSPWWLWPHPTLTLCLG